MLTRRSLFWGLSGLGLNPLLLRGAESVRGRFEAGGAIVDSQGRRTKLTGDDPTKLVLNDARLNGMDLEALGSRSGEGSFAVGPIHERNLWVHRKGERLMVTYWCDICYIRTYSPGQCWCCQEETKLDLKDPNSKDPTP